MKRKLKPLLIWLLIFVLESCNQDPCEVDHTIVNGECIPDFIYPQNPNLKSGDRYFHPEFGIVVFKDSLWYDNNNKPLKKLNARSF